MRIAIPLNENNGEESEISPHFGHAGFVGIYDSKTEKLEINPVETLVQKDGAIIATRDGALFAKGKNKASFHSFTKTNDASSLVAMQRGTVGTTSISKGKRMSKKTNETEGCSPINTIEKLNVDIIYCLGMGMKAMNLCEEKGIKLKTGKFKTIKEIIDNQENLEDFKETCGY